MNAASADRVDLAACKRGSGHARIQKNTPGTLENVRDSTTDYWLLTKTTLARLAPLNGFKRLTRHALCTRFLTYYFYYYFLRGLPILPGPRSGVARTASRSQELMKMQCPQSFTCTMGTICKDPTPNILLAPGERYARIWISYDNLHDVHGIKEIMLPSKTRLSYWRVVADPCTQTQYSQTQ